MKEKIKDENKKDTKQKKPRKKASWLANTTLTLLLIIIIIAVVVAINVIVEKQDIADIDLTGNKLFSLSQESIDKISSVKSPTKITLYQMSNYPEAINYAKLYCQKNSNITYEELTDASQRPDLQEKYSLGTSITSAVVIVEANNRDKIVSANDFYAYDNTTYQQYDVTEQKMTNAILDVNLETNPKIYFSTTHAEDSNYYQVARELLKNEANDVEDLDLLVNAKVPDDCNVLVITSLKEDFTEFEKDLILEYINNGGNLMILEDPNKDNKDLTNFQAILDVYGASISNGTMFEQNTSKIVGYTNLVLPTVSSASKITKDIASSGNVAILGGGIINFKDSEELENLGVTVENLVTASSTAFLRTDSSITSSSVTQNDKLLSGGEPIASAITKKINDEKTSKLILVANSMFASDWYVTLNSSSGNSSQVVAINFYNNRDLVINSVSYLTDREDNITIRKDTGVATYTATVNNGTISLSATPYTGTYDGKAHNAITKVTVTPSDAKIDYSTDGKTYSTTMPTITNTSSFTVTVRASKAGYKTQSTTQTVKVGGQIVIGTIKVVENSNGSGTAIAANGALTGKDLYITFSHSIASGSTSVSPSLPYKVTKNGTYTFTVTGTSNGITSKKTVSVTVNQYMSSSTGSNPYLPGNDFKKVDGTDLSNGLVIEDKDGSQYVWIEVPKTSTVYPTAGTNITNFDSAAYTKITADLENYTKAYKSGGYSDADDDAKHVMLKSVYENGGFYIGRFEEGTANAEESTTEGTSAGPVSKINMYPYRLLTLPEAMDLTKKVNAGNRTCTLMYEVQWNLVLAHLHNKGNISDTVLTQNSDSIGNTSSVSFTLNRGKYYANNNRGWQAYNVDYYNEDDEYYLVKSKVKQKHAALLTTGAADRNKVMNIYDFAGNVAEWTIGVYSSTHWPCVVRGNSYNSGSNAAYHGDAAWYDYDGNIGFRVSIY